MVVLHNGLLGLIVPCHVVAPPISEPGHVLNPHHSKGDCLVHNKVLETKYKVPHVDNDRAQVGL